MNRLNPPKSMVTHAKKQNAVIDNVGVGSKREQGTGSICRELDCMFHNAHSAIIGNCWELPVAGNKIINKGIIYLVLAMPAERKP